MIDLPAALAPWATELSLLSPDLALTVAPWVGRLALALGPMSESRTAESVEPDGYGGLARRGSYERLVTAEWAMADLYPDEFLRRAAAGEHLFLDLSRRGPRGALRSIAIVSAGPDQLGAPRLLHLALLIVLSRRAAAAGASFAWGVLEDREHHLVDGFDAAGIRRLLDARTALTAEESSVAAWRAKLGGKDPSFDVWFAAGRRTVPWVRHVGASSLAVTDVLEPAARAVEIAVTRRGTPAQLRFELPAPEVCARLLRDPLAQGSGNRIAATRAGGKRLRFAANGTKLLLIGDYVVESWPIPNSPRDKLGAPRDSTVIRPLAVGLDHRMVLALTAHDTYLSLQQSNQQVGFVELPAELVPELQAERAAPPGPIGGMGRVKLRGATQDLIFEVLGRMFMVAGASRTNMPSLSKAMAFVTDEEGRVLASWFRPTTVLWAQRTAGGEVHVIRTTAAGTARIARAPSDAPGQAIFGHVQGGGDQWAVASREHGTTWRVLAERHSGILSTDAPVVGLNLDRDGRASLLTQSGDRRLAWVGPGAREPIPAASGPIADAALSPYGPRVAWVTADGEVVVYSLDHKAMLMRLSPSSAGMRSAT